MMRVRVMKLKKTSLAVAAALALGSASAVHAEIGLKAGAWDLSFSGNVNGFLTRNSCDNSAATVNGGLACNNAGGVKEVAIESGLLPSALVFSGKSSQSGWDIGVTIGFYPGLNDGGTAGKRGLSTSTIDLRQNFLTFGDKTVGTIKVGKDIGLFGSDAILADMTLLGVGSAGAFGGGNTTLGRIGVGYIYTDWIPQISYSSPKHGGFQYSAGVFQGMDVFAFSGNATSVSLTAHEQPGLQAKGSYEWAGTVGGKAWVSAMTQKFQARTGDATAALVPVAIPQGRSVSGQAFDLGAKLNVADFEGVLYAYSADGIGTTAIGFDAAAVVGGAVEKRKSKGGYVQGTYTIGKLKPGVSYGESRLDLASNESAG